MPAAQLPASGGGGATDLDGLTDVAITSPASGQTLRHNGTQFVNAATGISDVTNLQTSLDAKQATSQKNAASGYAGLDANSKLAAAQMSEVMPMGGLSDVTITSPASGQVVRHNGTGFVNAGLAPTDMPSGIDAAKVGGGTVSNAEFAYLDGVTGPIQTQIDNKLAAGTVPISSGGTGATTAAGARANLEVADIVHGHNAADINSGIVSVARGGTGLGSIGANRLLGSGSASNAYQSITTGAGLSLSNGVLSSTVSAPFIWFLQVLNRQSATINGTAWQAVGSANVTLPSSGAVLMNASTTIEALSGQPLQSGYWRLRLTQGSSNLYFPNSTGQRIVAPYNGSERMGLALNWVTGLDSGTWTAAVEWKSDSSSNSYYSRDASCTVLAIAG